MKKIKYISLIVLTLFGVFTISSSFIGYPIVLDFSKNEESNYEIYQKGGK